MVPISTFFGLPTIGKEEGSLDPTFSILHLLGNIGDEVKALGRILTNCTTAEERQRSGLDCKLMVGGTV